MKLKGFIKLVFHAQSLILIPALLFLWYAVNLYADNHVDEDELIAHNGQVIFLDTIFAKPEKDLKFNGNSKVNYFRVKLHNQPERVFTILTNPTYSNYERITSNVKVGDRITIFTKPQLGSGIGVRESNTIVKIAKSNESVVEFKRSTRSGFLVLLPISMFLFAVFIFMARKRYAPL